MHIFFSGIGGAGIGPLALIAHQAGFTVSGSDKKDSQYTHYLEQSGISLHIGQTTDAIAAVHAASPIDWLVISSAVPLENPKHPELEFAKMHNIKVTKRDELLNLILQEKDLKLLAVAGTHGKTTTTAMVIWGCQQLQIPVSYSVGAKISFGDMGHYEPGSEYFVYECDEFDRNFLQFFPFINGITTIDWDHHDIFPTRDDYKAAFKQYIAQSKQSVIFESDRTYLKLELSEAVISVNDDDPLIGTISLVGNHNRRNAFIAATMLQQICEAPLSEILNILSKFPGSQRRFEKLADNIYTDYAHTPEEIAATIQLAKELNQKIVVAYEPLTNKRQHYMKDLYATIFEGVETVYWLPSYLAREDPDQHVLTPDELIAGLSPQTHAQVAAMDDTLVANLKNHATEGALVLCLAGGGGYSLDEFMRAQLGVQ